ncbi:MAG: hypothetical protein ABL958_10770 [Bdellovibrionia bacterium]
MCALFKDAECSQAKDLAVAKAILSEKLMMREFELILRISPNRSGIEALNSFEKKWAARIENLDKRIKAAGIRQPASRSSTGAMKDTLALTRRLVQSPAPQPDTAIKYTLAYGLQGAVAYLEGIKSRSFQEFYSSRGIQIRDFDENTQALADQVYEIYPELKLSPELYGQIKTKLLLTAGPDLETYYSNIFNESRPLSATAASASDVLSTEGPLGEDTILARWQDEELARIDRNFLAAFRDIQRHLDQKAEALDSNENLSATDIRDVLAAFIEVPTPPVENTLFWGTLGNYCERRRHDEKVQRTVEALTSAASWTLAVAGYIPETALLARAPKVIRAAQLLLRAELKSKAPALSKLAGATGVFSSGTALGFFATDAVVTRLGLKNSRAEFALGQAPASAIDGASQVIKESNNGMGLLALAIAPSVGLEQIMRVRSSALGHALPKSAVYLGRGLWAIDSAATANLMLDAAKNEDIQTALMAGQTLPFDIRAAKVLFRRPHANPLLTVTLKPRKH